ILPFSWVVEVADPKVLAAKEKKKAEAETRKKKKRKRYDVGVESSRPKTKKIKTKVIEPEESASSVGTKSPCPNNTAAPIGDSNEEDNSNFDEEVHELFRGFPQ
ncbi:hypothetical protein Tco_0994832, partial [Tanacetum coccineum]